MARRRPPDPKGPIERLRKLLDAIADDAYVDFLGTGSSQQAADKAKRQWRELFDHGKEILTEMDTALTRELYNLSEPIRFTDLVVGYQIRQEHQKVKHNTTDDFGLGPWSYYAGGGYLRDSRYPVDSPKTSWTTIWVRLKPWLMDQLRPRMCEGLIGSFVLTACGDGLIRWVARDRKMIATVLGSRVIEVPADICLVLGVKTDATK